MSSLLEQAILDAKMLKEASIKRAQEAIVEQYAEEIKQYAKMITEQDEGDALPDLGGGDMPAPSLDLSGPTAEATPDAQKVVDRIPPAYLGEDNLQEIEINLDSIVEKIDALQKDLNMKVMPSFDEPVHAPIEQGNPTRIAVDGLAESVDGNDGDLDNLTEESDESPQEDQIEEELMMDMDTVDHGGIANTIELKKQVEISAALEAQNDDLQEQLNVKAEELDVMESKLQSMLAKLQETKGKLKKSVDLNVQLKEGFQFLTGKINEVNLLNARLLYTNKVLGNVSLNERQKKQIAESISNSKTVEEAKTIYETLQRSAQTIVEKRSVPQSLTEAITRTSSAFLPRNNAASANDPNVERWQRIAGIKK